MVGVEGVRHRMLGMRLVGIVGECEESFELLRALGQACDVDICRAASNDHQRCAGYIILGGINPQEKTLVSSESPTIRVLFAEHFENEASVTFGVEASSPLPFRGRTLRTMSAVPDEVRCASGEVIASVNGVPIWTASAEGATRRDTCCVPKDWVGKGDCAFDHLNGKRFMNLLPLVEWLRWISGACQWNASPLHACFMFDDPNLHATKYGYIAYAHLATEGRRHRYHTAFATVPLDGYYVHQRTAQLIRENSDTLSLLIHGNNHTRLELAGNGPVEERVGLMVQALDRINRLERKGGVAVSRVMAPPHGVCSARMMSAMLEAGFEAVCVSHGSVWTGNPGQSWTVALGAYATMVVNGLPVIPRLGLGGNPANRILVAAYLNQPIIPMGHHWDLADGTEVLSSLAGLINGLGEVCWGDLSTIARSNYRWRTDGVVMDVRVFSRVTAIQVPEGVSELRVRAEWVDRGEERIECWTEDGANQSQCGALEPGLSYRVEQGRTVQVRVLRQCRKAEQTHEVPRTSLGAIARRIFVEMRDRSMPYVPRRRLAKTNG
jgi:hypothetical protein